MKKEIVYLSIEGKMVTFDNAYIYETEVEEKRTDEFSDVVVKYLEHTIIAEQIDHGALFMAAIFGNRDLEIQFATHDGIYMKATAQVDSLLGGNGLIESLDMNVEQMQWVSVQF